MLTIYNLSTNEYIEEGLRFFRIYGYDGKYVQTLIDNNIINFGLLEEAVLSGKAMYQHEEYIDALAKAQKKVKALSGRVKPIQFYEFPKYQASGLNIDVLNNTDAQVMGDVLPVTTILNIDSSNKEHLANVNIYDLKRMLSRVEPSGRNSCFDYTGIKKINRVAEAIQFYDDQVLRVAQNTPNLDDYEGNLFMKDKDVKEKVVRMRLHEIGLVLLDQGNSFIWGDMSDEKAYELFKLCLGVKGYEKQLMLNNFVQVLSDYMTYQEITAPQEELALTLQRFIK